MLAQVSCYTFVLTFAVLFQSIAIVTWFAFLAVWSHRIVEAALTFSCQAVTGVVVIWVDVVVAKTHLTTTTRRCQVAIETRATSVTIRTWKVTLGHSQCIYTFTFTRWTRSGTQQMTHDTILSLSNLQQCKNPNLDGSSIQTDGYNHERGCSYLHDPLCNYRPDWGIVDHAGRTWQKIVRCPELLDTGRAHRAVLKQGPHSNLPHTWISNTGVSSEPQQDSVWIYWNSMKTTVYCQNLHKIVVH